MDNQDQEVVREPFEEPDEFNDNCSPSNECQNNNLYVQTSIDNKSMSCQKEISTNNNIDEDCSSTTSETSLPQQDDVEFANSFGINLKTKNLFDNNDNKQNIYGKLVNSKHLLSTPNDSSSTSKFDEHKIKTSITTDCIYHRGTFYQKGDIVALCDQDDAKLYFAQITGFLQDQYCEKSASLNWLVPIRATSRDFFDPSAYRIGLEDHQLRKLDCMTFIRHCPHDYYLRKLFQKDHEDVDLDSVSYKRSRRDQAYIWTTMKPCSVPTIDCTKTTR